MAFPHEHLLIRFNGHFGATATVVDRWSSGIRIGHPAAGTPYDAGKLQTLVNAAKTAADTFHGTSSVLIGANCFLDEVTGAMIGVLGKYVPVGQNTIISSNVTPKAGTSSASQPWNTAHVISLRTGNPRGRASNGRIYWPANGTIVQDLTGRLSAGQVTPRLTAFKTFLDALNTAADAYDEGAGVCVFSNVGGGTAARVTSIRADQRLDSIERRENDQPPVWMTLALA